MKKIIIVFLALFMTTFLYSKELKFLDIATETSTIKDVQKTLKDKKIKYTYEKDRFGDYTKDNNIVIEMDEYEGLKCTKIQLLFNKEKKFTSFKLIFKESENTEDTINQVLYDLLIYYEISKEKNEYKVISTTIYSIWSFSEDMKYFMSYGGDSNGVNEITVEKRL